LALAAARAVLEHMKKEGPGLQEEVALKMEKFAGELNAYFALVEAPLKLAHFSSISKLGFTEDLPYGEILYMLLREKGVHIWDGRPCFTTTAHSEEDLANVLSAFKESVEELQSVAFLPGLQDRAGDSQGAFAQNPPIPGARLGRDPSGQPGWFVPDPARSGKFLKVASVG
jgi:hypothetical protein